MRRGMVIRSRTRMALEQAIIMIEWYKPSRVCVHAQVIFNCSHCFRSVSLEFWEFGPAVAPSLSGSSDEMRSSFPSSCLFFCGGNTGRDELVMR